MASNTKKTKTIRAWHKKKAGKARKAKLRTQGTTPAFPIHTAPAKTEAQA